MAELNRPPQQQKLNGAYYVPNAYPVGDNRKRPSGRRSRIGFCCRCLCSTLLAIIFALGIAALVIWLVLRPKAPKYTVQDVRINALNVTSGSRSVDTDIVLGIRAENPNKRITIKYGGIHTRVFFLGTQIGAGSIAPFTQPRRNVTVVSAPIRGSGVLVSQPTASSLRASVDRSSIPLVVDVNVRAKIKTGSASTFWFRVRVRCAIRVSSPASPGGARMLSKNCKRRGGKFW
ncbi:NDR1/HIN1-like protein 6 [Selaginella moellendorffii]|nr:NDR1/HIN1-like protein 6 [Selaginella moellendorffii]|eukprot:XP_002976870.2 NDR1/HIN1-like protein 6 [Selaginella moellendorffii]